MKIRKKKKKRWTVVKEGTKRKKKRSNEFPSNKQLATMQTTLQLFIKQTTFHQTKRLANYGIGDVYYYKKSKKRAVCCKGNKALQNDFIAKIVVYLVVRRT